MPSTSKRDLADGQVAMDDGEPQHAQDEFKIDNGQDAHNDNDDDDLEEDEEQQDQEQYGHEYFCEVAEDFIEDDFNLTGLNGLVPFYKEAMEMVLDVEAGKSDDEGHRVPDVSLVESSAELLYGLIHQRYIITRQGLQQMYAKFDAGHFGHCPRVYCSSTKLVPCGRSDLPGVDTVKLFCPSCVDMYVPPSSRFQGVDGAFFGTTFPHLLFQTYPTAVSLPTPAPAPSSGPRESTNPSTSLAKVYVPKIYGFKVSEKARSGPRMQWLRMRPRYAGEVDWSDSEEREDHDDRPEGEREHGAFYSGPEDDEDDEEDVSEDEATKDGQDGSAQQPQQQQPAAGNDKMQTSDSVAAANSAGVSASDKSRPVRPLPRSSLGSTASNDFATTVVTSTHGSPVTTPAATRGADAILRNLNLDEARAITRPAPVAKAPARSIASAAKSGFVTAVKTIAT
ncbi:casein kinase 2 regulatory subunit [Microbotryomycetes sp. JL221]|nr:casein kinase 2 regulatory subunit [Microbotryomycetes sp. JL221]